MSVCAKFPEGKSVDVAKYLRDHGNAEAAEEWERMNEEHGGKFKKRAWGGTPSPVARLPRAVKSVLKQLKYKKRQINVEAATSYTVYYPGDDAYRGFCAVVNLDPTHVDIQYGDWGGGGLGARPKAVDTDESPKPLRDGVVVIKGQVGGRGTYAFITATPATVEQLMGTDKTAAKLFELVYSSGGTGGPYRSEGEAKKRAELIMDGGRDAWIVVIPAEQNIDLRTARPTWVLIRDRGWKKGGGQTIAQATADNRFRAAAKGPKKKVTDWMWVISKDSAGGFIVTLGDPKKSGSKIKARFSDKDSAKDELRDWVRDNVGKAVSPNHIIDISGQKLVPDTWDAKFVEELPEKQRKQLKLAASKWEITFNTRRMQFKEAQYTRAFGKGNRSTTVEATSEEEAIKSFAESKNLNPFYLAARPASEKGSWKFKHAAPTKPSGPAKGKGRVYEGLKKGDVLFYNGAEQVVEKANKDGSQVTFKGGLKTNLRMDPAYEGKKASALDSLERMAKVRRNIREGTRVILDVPPYDRMAYNSTQKEKLPPNGTRGRVITRDFGAGPTTMSQGRIYVQWDKGSVLGMLIHPNHLVRDTGRTALDSLERMAKEKYPWKQCIKDQLARYGDQETAEKVCGKIRAESGGKAALDELASLRGKTARRQMLMPKAIAAKIPKLYSQEDVVDPVAWVKFFNPYGRGTWLITEFDGRDMMFGLADLGHPELGYISLKELESLEYMPGIQQIERDTSFRPAPLSVAAKAERINWRNPRLANRVASIDDSDTLDQLVEMELENVGAEVDDVEAGKAVQTAAKKFDDAVKKALLKWLKDDKNKTLLDLNGRLLRRTKKDQDIVDVLMDLRGGAGYLYFMEMEGHGVGTWDGDWDPLFHDHRKGLKDLSKYMERAVRKEYHALKAALEERAYELEEESKENDEDFGEAEMESGVVISDSRGGYALSAEGKHLDDFSDFGDALEAANDWMDEHNYWPNLYHVNDHGNVDLIDKDGNILNARVAGKTAKVPLKVRAGTRVVMNANPVSRALYTNPPANGTEGTVVAIPVPGGKRTYMAGPGGGLVYVEWEGGYFMGVSPNDLDKVQKKKAARAAAGWADFGKPGTKGGQYWGRRAKDSKVLRMKDAEAKKTIAQKKTSDPSGLDWLAVWWVPPEYVKAKEQKFRIKRGWLDPVWAWESGSQKGGVKKASWKPGEAEGGKWETGIMEPEDPQEEEGAGGSLIPGMEERLAALEKMALREPVYYISIVKREHPSAMRLLGVMADIAMDVEAATSAKFRELGKESGRLGAKLSFEDAKALTTTLLNFGHAIQAQRRQRVACGCGDEPIARFEEGKPADPTENMSPEDAKKWREMKDEHKDKFKAAHGRSKTAYFSVLIEPGPTKWQHPSKALSRGAFKSEREAHGWAKRNIPGEPYSVQEFDDPEKVEEAMIEVARAVNKTREHGVRVDQLPALGVREMLVEKVVEAERGYLYPKQPAFDRFIKGLRGVRLGSLEERWGKTMTRKVARAPSGLYGYPKKVQADCEAAGRKVAKRALALAKKAYQKDERVAEFLGTHAKRSRNDAAHILVGALQTIGPKVAAEMEKTARLEELRAQRQGAASRAQKENAIAAKTPPDSKKGRGKNRTIMLTGDVAKVLGKDNYESVKLSELSDADIDKLHNLLVRGKKAASDGTLKIRRDGGDYWIEGLDLEGPFSAAQVVGEVEKRLQRPGIIVLGPNHSLGKQTTAVDYSKAPYVVFDKRGTPVDEGYSLQALWRKWFDRFLGWRMATSEKTAARKYGLYGFPSKTASLGLSACTQLREFGGHTAADLHMRRASKHARYTGFLKQHSKEAGCLYARMLHGCYPGADCKMASTPAPQSVEDWLRWED